jgi:hypothetical protein
MFRCIVTWQHSVWRLKPRILDPYPGAPQIIHSEDRAYDIPAHLVEDQDLPYRAIRGRIRGLAARLILRVNVGDGCVQVQYALYASYKTNISYVRDMQEDASYLFACPGV